VGRALGYGKTARWTVWAPTLPQVAATLAAALVADNTRNVAGQRLLDTAILNAVLVLMLITSILGPLLVERSAPRMLANRVIMPAVDPLPPRRRSGFCVPRYYHQGW
jgi:Na+:H+ antiporter